MPVSVIIPTLNEAERVAGAIRQAWQAGADEVIVADGGSDDATCDLARGEQCTLVESERGRGRQQNAGARRAAGDVLLFLHADTWLAPGGVDQVRRALADAAVRGGAAQGGAFCQRIEAEGRLYRWLERGNAWRARRRGLPYGDQGIFMRREMFNALGGFPEVGLMEDLLLMKAFRRRARPVLLEGPLHVSPRRWRRHGVVRQTMRNWLLLTAAAVGVAPDRLAAFYRLHGEGAKDGSR